MSKFVDNNGLLYFWQKLKTLFAGKVDVETGKGLSTNDYTDVEKTKLAGIAAGATKVTVDSALSSSSTNPVQNSAINTALGNKVNTADVVTNATDIGVAGNAGKPVSCGAVEDYVSTNAYELPTASTTLGGVRTTSDVSNATGLTASPIISGVVYYHDTTYDEATSSADGLMSSTDKAKLDAFGAANTYALKSDIANAYIYTGSVANAAALPASATPGAVYNTEDTGMNYAWNGTSWDALGETFTIDTITNAEIDTIMA